MLPQDVVHVVFQLREVDPSVTVAQEGAEAVTQQRERRTPRRHLTTAVAHDRVPESSIKTQLGWMPYFFLLVFCTYDICAYLLLMSGIVLRLFIIYSIFASF